MFQVETQQLLSFKTGILLNFQTVLGDFRADALGSPSENFYQKWSQTYNNNYEVISKKSKPFPEVMKNLTD